MFACICTCTCSSFSTCNCTCQIFHLYLDASVQTSASSLWSCHHFQELNRFLIDYFNSILDFVFCFFYPSVLIRCWLIHFNLILRFVYWFYLLFLGMILPPETLLFLFFCIASYSYLIFLYLCLLSCIVSSDQPQNLIYPITCHL